MEPGQEYSSCDDNMCALATWSDWDLGVCLQYECRRKQIRKPAYFDQWIDLRAVYKQFYDRRPSGLCGSLEDLGIAFTGREHCGLDDARNTAKLCYRLVKDGCKLNVTKSLWTKAAAPLIRAPDLSKEAERRMEESTAQKQPSLNTHKPVTTIEESPTLGDKENTSQNASLESPSGAQLRKITAEEGQVKTSPSDESFLNGIVHEFDELEKNNFSEVPTTTQCTHTDKCSSIKSLNISTACPKANSTPSRSNFLSHISPVTLLPPHNTRKITTANLSARQQHTSACTSAPRLLQSLTTHTPKPPTPLPVQQQPPPPPTTIDTSMPHRDANSSTTKQMERRPSFRTPSTTKWIRAKSFQSSSSSILSCDSPQPFNGGKLTPPLCKCGKRAKRKFVTSPGPNQGRPFFSCPGGRGSGCQYFRWESSSPNRSPHTDSSSAG
jgi:ERI1 exoribonuclease 2